MVLKWSITFETFFLRNTNVSRILIDGGVLKKAVIFKLLKGVMSIHFENPLHCLFCNLKITDVVELAKPPNGYHGSIPHKLWYVHLHEHSLRKFLLRTFYTHGPYGQKNEVGDRSQDQGHLFFLRSLYGDRPGAINTQGWDKLLFLSVFCYKILQ